MGSKNYKLNKGVCTNVQEERASSSWMEKKISNKGLLLPVSELFIAK